MIKKLEEKIIYWQDKNSIRLLREDLENQRVCVTSTDTVLGFLAVTKEKSFEMLQQLKGERKNKPFLIIVENFSKLKHFVDVDTISENLKNLLHHCWPGPVTIVFQAKKNCPSFLTSEQGTIALRCPAHQGLQKILAFFDGLFSTSANKTGQPFPIESHDLNCDIVQNVKHIVLDRQKNDAVVPSTILDCSNIAKQGIKVLREGAYPIHLLEDYYGSKFNSSAL